MILCGQATKEQTPELMELQSHDGAVLVRPQAKGWAFRGETQRRLGSVAWVSVFDGVSHTRAATASCMVASVGFLRKEIARLGPGWGQIDWKSDLA
jgi:hypothetical protein